LNAIPSSLLVAQLVIHFEHEIILSAGKSDAGPDPFVGVSGLIE
jgi:hypothetical protein